MVAGGAGQSLMIADTPHCPLDVTSACRSSGVKTVELSTIVRPFPRTVACVGPKFSFERLNSRCFRSGPDILSHGGACIMVP